MASNMLNSKPMNHSPICSINVAVLSGVNYCTISEGIICQALIQQMFYLPGLLSDGGPLQAYEPAIITTDYGLWRMCALATEVHLRTAFASFCF